MSELLVEQLQVLLPPVAYDPKGEVLLAQLTAEGAVLGDALSSLEAVQAAVFPTSAGPYIGDWERVYELTPADNATQEQRVQAVEMAMADLGGQSKPYFIRVASLYGVSAAIESFRVPVVGLLKVGEPMYAGDWPYTWRIDSPLSAYVSSNMEARIFGRRPANTDVVFGYGKEVADIVTEAMDHLFNAMNYLIPNAVSANNG